MEYFSISRDIKNHFERFPKYITPRGVIFYNKKNYDEYVKKYEEVDEKEQSKK